MRAYIVLAKQYNFERERIEAFFEAMRMDTQIDRYATYEQLQTYMYGSAEVI
ncbi:squalene/phytoene synthase family protein [Patescibacteria group bacterium]|nr:squalene/phytoene synthase family protein [Patescibacteria group bacterium]